MDARNNGFHTKHARQRGAPNNRDNRNKSIWRDNCVIITAHEVAPPSSSLLIYAHYLATIGESVQQRITSPCIPKTKSPRKRAFCASEIALGLQCVLRSKMGCAYGNHACSRKHSSRVGAHERGRCQLEQQLARGHTCYYVVATVLNH